MNLEKLVAISGIGGIHKIAANRDNGLIIEDFDTGKRRFVGSRKYQFTPLGSVTIYSSDPEEVILLSDVFGTMLEKKGTLPVADVKASKDALHAYFAQIMPKYDADLVHASDMKKIIKWFNFLDKRDILTQLKKEAEEAKKEEEKLAAEKESAEEATKKEAAEKEDKKEAVKTEDKA